MAKKASKAAKKAPTKKSKGSKKSIGPLLVKVFAGGLVLFAVLALLLITLVRKGVFGPLPTEQDLTELQQAEATLVLARNGAVIGKVFARDRTNVRYVDLPEHLVQALVATEDQRFFQHEGVDAWSYARVFVRTILGRDRKGGGGSTISQQIIKNLYGRERHGVLTVPVNKVKEALVAQRLERAYSKEDVLTLYFNSVQFGENLYGVEAAAQRYFSKTTSKLKVEEAAVLVGMLKANSSYNPRRYPDRSKGRRDQVLELMATRGYLSEAKKDSLRALPLTLRYVGRDVHDAYGYFSAKVEREARALLKEVKGPNGRPYDIEMDGLRIHTTLDTGLQRMALRAVAAHLKDQQPKLDKQLSGAKARAAWEKRMAKKGGPAWKENEKSPRDLFRWERPDAAPEVSFRDSLWHYHSMLHAAVYMQEPGSGKVRAWVGGNDHRKLPYDLVEARRPIASTIKPVIYAAAVEKGFTPCDYFDNTKRTYAEYNDWSPDNFSNDTLGGRVAMWSSLARSLNLPTVDLYFRTGADTVRQVFRALDLPDGNVDNPSVALGAADISLRSIVSAYGAFAMRGRKVEPVLIEKIVAPNGKVIWQAEASTGKQAIQPATAAAITTMLETAVNSGTGAGLRTRHGVTVPIAGKTGTSQDNSDAWFVAYTPGLVVGTWVGAMDPSVHFRGSAGTGGQLALPIVGRVLRDVQRDAGMKGRYLLPFSWVEEFPVDLDCPAQRAENDSFFQRLFNPSDGANTPREEPKKREREAPTPEQQERKNLLERIFGKKKK